MRLIDADVLPEISLFGTTEYINVNKAPTVQAIKTDMVRQAREEISKQFVDLQDGSEEWRSYVNEAVLECVEILDKLIAESEGK